MYISILSDYPCLEVVYGTVRRRRRRGCRRWCRSDLICPAGWLSARLDVRTYVRTGYTRGCVFTPVLCCAVLCASTTLLRSVVRVRARAHTVERVVLCVWSSLLRALLPYGGGGWLVWHRRDKSAGDLSLYFTSPACASM